MTTLRIQCETCQATLRVRDQGFVGEVHACPRCGSMVLISGDAAPQSPVPAEEPLALGLSGTLETVAEPDPDPPVATEPDPLPQPPAAPPASSGVSAWAPIATTAVALATTAVIGGMWLLSPPEERPSESVAAATDPPPQAGQPTPSEPELLPEPTPEPDPPEPEPLEPASAPADTTNGLADALPPEPTPAESPGRTAPPTPEPEPLPAPTLPEAPAGEIDPLEFDPSEIAYAVNGGSARPPRPAPPRPAPAAADAPRIDQRLAAAARRAGLFVRRGPSDATTGPFTGSAEAALAQVLPAIDLRDIPLDEACQLVSDLSGAPVTLPPTALRRAGILADRPINLVGEQQTLGALLAAGLKQARLGLETDGPHVRVIRLGANRQRSITHRVADLSDPNPLQFASAAGEALGLEDPLPLSPGGEADLTAPMGTHYDLLVYCERLRVERGLATNSKYPTDLLSASAADRLAPLMSRRTTFSFVEPTQLAEVFRHWRRVTGVPILVDWRALSSAGLGPRSTIECSVTNRSWRDALDGALQALGLRWEPAFGGAIWLTAGAAGGT